VRSRWIVSYDVADAKRLRRVYKALLGYGDWIQLSVFRCDLTAHERVRLQSVLEQEIRPQADQILFMDLGPVEGRGSEAVGSIGRPLVLPPRAIVL
jgi:CRISPR-associated protein Cas2